VDTSLTAGINLRFPYFNFGDSQWAVLDGKLKILPELDFDRLTHLLVVNDFRPKQMPALPADQKLLIILDGSIPFYRWEDWRKQADELGWRLHITGEDGAYQLLGE